MAKDFKITDNYIELKNSVKKKSNKVNWRPSNAFNEAIERLYNVFGGDDDDRTDICRMALKAHRNEKFEYVKTNKKEEKGVNYGISLEIKDAIIYSEKILGIKLSIADVEGIVIAWCEMKIKNKPERKIADYEFDYSYI